MRADVVVVGAGMVGAAIAYGLASRGVQVVLVDGDDRDFRSANANFGLVWVHGKGMDMPAYQRLTRDAALDWIDFSSELADVADIDLQYQRDGGLALCLSAEEFEQRRANLLRLDEQLGTNDRAWRMLDRDDVERLLPKVRLGPDVIGASFGLMDGHVNPLRLLAGLQRALVRKGGRLLAGHAVHAIASDGHGGFQIKFGSERISAARVVISAGLGSAALGAQVGLTVPVRPQRGQILVTERLAPFLPVPMLDVRQTMEGTVMLGITTEETGYDAAATTVAAASISANAVRQIPGLANATLVRQWGGLRIMSPDGFPIYAESTTHPGAFVTVCHSGVTLAPVHAHRLAAAVVDGVLPQGMKPFSQERFDVQKAT